MIPAALARLKAKAVGLPGFPIITNLRRLCYEALTQLPRELISLDWGTDFLTLQIGQEIAIYAIFVTGKAS